MMGSQSTIGALVVFGESLVALPTIGCVVCVEILSAGVTHFMACIDVLERWSERWLDVYLCALDVNFWAQKSSDAQN